MKHLKPVFFITLLAIALFNSWIKFLWQNQNYLQILIIVFLSVLLAIFNKSLSRMKYLVFVIPLMAMLLFLPRTNVFRLDNLEIYTINQRRTYYSNKTLARLMENKVCRYAFNYQKNFFEGLDLNYYFFGTHPRERVGVKEIKKFSFAFLPFFIYGAFVQLKSKRWYSFVYFTLVLIVASFFSPIDAFSFLFLPFFAFNINIGLWAVLVKFKKLKLGNVF